MGATQGLSNMRNTCLLPGNIHYVCMTCISNVSSLTDKIQLADLRWQECESIALDVQLAQTRALGQLAWQRDEVVVAQHQLSLRFYYNLYKD